MSERMILFLIFILFAGSVSNCAVGPVYGYLYTSTSFPGELNVSNAVTPAKKGQSCMTSFAGLVTWGSSSAGKLALENKITRISTIDHSTKSYVGLIRKYCTIIAGE
ncbi:TRL-like family protein [Leptospira inadai]|uniref:TRL-like family protein n=1 Tax=Leptospira inadai serovar Lyme TaxID=293084 RepID=A0ABX4YIZ7_9LEPT|nr:TRL-like family protein [Leptospira inadai]PNV75251.1 TRL-like family protein [Leptospira inadai serovar Lyme]